jgi:hypothetical protein
MFSIDRIDLAHHFVRRTSQVDLTPQATTYSGPVRSVIHVTEVVNPSGVGGRPGGRKQGELAPHLCRLAPGGCGGNVREVARLEF